MGRLGVAVALGLLAWAVVGGAQAEPMGTKRDPWAQRLHSQLLAQASVQAGRRSALVIGNGAYAEERLANAVNDAEAVARTLQEIGFTVTLVRNGDKRTIDEAVEAFSRRLGPGEIGLFYFSGHGVQVEGENYLVPINAQLNRQADTQYDAVPLGKVINAVEATSATAKIIILDACRNNPFYRRWRSTARGSTARGLATPVTSGSGGTLIAFSTAPGKVAADGIGNNPNSPFTTHLLRHLRTPNLEVGQLFRLVRGDVVQATRKEQIPWESGSLVGEVYLNPRTAAPVEAAQPAEDSTAKPKAHHIIGTKAPLDTDPLVLLPPARPKPRPPVVPPLNPGPSTVAAAPLSATTPLQQAAMGKNNWRSYGPLQINWSWEPRGDSTVTAIVNANGDDLFISINCGARRINITNTAGQWGIWTNPTSDWEINLVNDFCSRRSG